MATLITDKNRNLLLPKSDFLSDYWGCKFYSLPWATTESPQLLFDNFFTPLTVETNREFQIWYSENLFKWGYGDNGYEKTCVAVYGLYVWAAAKILKVHWRRDCQNCCSWVFITSILDSWNSLLYGLPQQDYNSFKIQQLELLHILGNYWLPVRNCMVYTILSLVYKAVSGAVPCNISDSLDYRTSKRTLRSSL